MGRRKSVVDIDDRRVWRVRRRRPDRSFLRPCGSACSRAGERRRPSASRWRPRRPCRRNRLRRRPAGPDARRARRRPAAANWPRRGPPFGRPKCASSTILAALLGDLADGGQHALDARRVGHLAVLHRHVEIDAQQYALAGDGGVVEGSERLGHQDASREPSGIGRSRSLVASGRWRLGRRLPSQMSLPIATAVSAMRLEKPHSLSYQDSTRTNVPCITLVWSSCEDRRMADRG